MSYNDKVSPKIGSLHYIWHFEMLTPINLGSHFFHFLGGLPKNHMVRRVVLQLLLQQQQDELNNGVFSMHSPYDNEERQRHDRWVPRPALCHPQLSPWTKSLHSANDPALITSCGIDFDSFLSLLTQVVVFTMTFSFVDCLNC